MLVRFSLILLNERAFLFPSEICQVLRTYSKSVWWESSTRTKVCVRHIGPNQLVWYSYIPNQQTNILRRCMLRGFRLINCPYWIRPAITISNHTGSELISSRLFCVFSHKLWIIICFLVSNRYTFLNKETSKNQRFGGMYCSPCFFSLTNFLLNLHSSWHMNLFCCVEAWRFLDKGTEKRSCCLCNTWGSWSNRINRRLQNPFSRQRWRFLLVNSLSSAHIFQIDKFHQPYYVFFYSQLAKYFTDW